MISPWTTYLGDSGTSEDHTEIRSGPGDGPVGEQVTWDAGWRTLETAKDFDTGCVFASGENPPSPPFRKGG